MGQKKASGEVTAPIIRVDREFLNEVELKLAEIALYQMAEMVNAIGIGGAIYGQLILPPDEAQMKLRAGQQAQNGGANAVG